MVGRVPPRRRAASSTRPSCSRTRSCPTNSSRVLRAQRRLDGPAPSARPRPRSTQARAVVGHGRRLAVARHEPAPGCAGRRAAASATSAGASPPRPRRVDRAATAVVGLAGRPAEADQGRRAPGRAQSAPRLPRRSPGAAPRRGGPSRSLSSSTQPLRALRPMPGTLISAIRSSVATARRSASGACTASIAWASRGPTPVDRLQQLEHGPLVVVGEAEQRQRVLAHDQGRWRAGPARRAAARRGCPGCTWTRQADPADLDDGRVRRRGRRPGRGRTRSSAPPAASTARACARCAAPGRRGCRALRRPAGRSRRRARGGRWRARARRRRRPGSGACGQPQQPGHHRADLGLVGAAVAGDGGLDLARGVQGDGEPARAAAQRWRPRWPGRCPSRCARCAG